MLFIAVLVASLVIASFFGHVVHWLLHQRWTGIMHRAHMEHHLELYPPGHLTSDKYKAAKWYHRGPLLFTPPLIIILGAAGGLLWWAGAPHWVVWVLGACLVGFGLVNDYFHDSFHVRKHRLNRYKWYKRLRRIHFVHHHQMGKNFGIFWFGWDQIFGTISDHV
jgi:hypothetical protein